MGAPKIEAFVKRFEEAGWSTSPSTSRQGVYELEHTWAALEVAEGEEDELFVWGKVFTSRADELGKLLDSNSRAFTADLRDGNDHLVDRMGLKTIELELLRNRDDDGV
jgi:hypothetical protein